MLLLEGENDMAKYGPKAQALVAQEMDAMKHGKLRSGSDAKVTNPKQAIAIALSEARRAGAKMLPPPEGTAAAEKEASRTKKASAKRTNTKSTGTVAKKVSTRKAPAKPKALAKPKKSNANKTTKAMG